VPHLGEGGRMVTIGNVNADRVPVTGLSVYAATKAAVGGLTRALARNSGPAALRSTTFSPAPSAPT
jgi:3-oxoacyl-[acyl-carrier protein] reductase